MKRICNFLRYGIVIALNVFIMVAFHSYVNFVLLVVLILFPFYSVWSLYKVKYKLAFQITVPIEPMEKKDEFYVHLALQNPTRYPLVNATVKLITANPFYQEEGIHYLNMPVRARKKTEVTYPVEMDYCGRFVIRAEEVRLMDLLGMVETVLPLSEERECMIFPKGELRNQEAGQLYMKGVAEAMESKEKGYDFSEISGIREYIPGDKLQNIHWKLSVKKDELMVKERISVSAMQLNVLVELANDDDMRLESVLELADSVTKSFVAQNLPFTVYYYSTNKGALTGTFIGSEVERREWLSMVLYDQSYKDIGRVEKLFLRDISTDSTYLYVGYANGTEETNALYGAQQTVAVLRGQL
ncbi:MAG: DUF58 domain-containing protein [Lachnospiraceae bacterium]|nr:DUF58 domain-containing protein [Lachnospiraceae bacterium]